MFQGRSSVVLSFFLHLIYYGGFDRHRVLDVRLRRNKYDIYTRLGVTQSTWDRRIMRLVKSGLIVRVSRARYKINYNIVLLSDDMYGSSLWEKPPEGYIEIENYKYKLREKKIKDY